MRYFEYGEVEIGHLRKRDARLGRAIEHFGILRAEMSPDLFPALVNSVISQQISGKAAITVWNRVRERFGEITLEGLSSATVEQIQSCGMSFRKAGYVKGIAEACANGDLDLDALRGMTDEQVTSQLSSLRGVGAWTAEMLLIFSLGRPDVLSWNDLAIRRGIMTLYGLDSLTRERFETLRRRYSPHGTVASLYIWEVAHLPPGSLGFLDG
jgi:3-methyladenine DNA glycosylase/8-oxoguanine DNA glycosylase